MSFRSANQIFRWLPILKAKNRRHFGRAQEAAPPPAEECPDLTCKKGKGREKQSSVWSKIRCKKSDEPKPPIESCKVKQAECKTPDLSEFEGKALSTCGPAYIIQQEVLASPSCATSAEDKALAVIESNAGEKLNLEDPMPEFTSVEQRMLDLSARRLHPFYKRYLNLPKRPRMASAEPLYKFKSGPIAGDEIPIKINFNLDLLEKKNLFAHFKRVEPPRQLVGKLIEINKNARPTLERRKMPVVLADAKQFQDSTVSDTLYQKETKF